MKTIKQLSHNEGLIKGLAIGFALGAGFVIALFYFNPLNF